MTVMENVSNWINLIGLNNFLIAMFPIALGLFIWSKMFNKSIDNDEYDELD